MLMQQQIIWAWIGCVGGPPRRFFNLCSPIDRWTRNVTPGELPFGLPGFIVCTINRNACTSSDGMHSASLVGGMQIWTSKGTSIVDAHENAATEYLLSIGAIFGN